MPSRFLFPLRNRYRSHGQQNHDGTGPATSPPSDATVETSPIIQDHDINGIRMASDDDDDRLHRHGHFNHHRSSEGRPKTSIDSISSVQNFRLMTIDQEHDDCAICTKRFKVGRVVTLLPCGHYFCSKCMGKWIENSHESTCPLCRYDLNAANTSHQKYYDSVVDSLPTTEKAGNQMSFSGTKRSNWLDTYAIQMEVLLFECQGSGDRFTTPSVATSTNQKLRAFGDNFNLIMAKTLHARRARIARKSSWHSDSPQEEKEVQDEYA